MNNRTRILVIISVVAVFVIGGLAIWLWPRGNPFGDELTIANIEQYTAGKPIDRETFNFISSILFQTVRTNGHHELTDDSISDIYIRDDTFSQTHDPATTRHEVSFIVDISSIRQSYRVRYAWYDNRANDPIATNPNFTSDYRSVVLCLPESELIYEPFNCVDGLNAEAGVDPILSALPYNAYNFQIRANATLSTIRLTITVLVFSTDPGFNNPTALVERYKQDALNWLIDQGFDPNNYAIEYVTIGL